MAQRPQPNCPECVEVNRRGFIGSLGRGAVALGALAPVAARAAEDASTVVPKPEKPAEAIIRELHSTLTSDQKKELVYAWDHREAGSDLPTRLTMVNRPHFSRKIGEKYTKPQQELVKMIVRAICSDDDGYRRITRNGTWDGSGSFEGAGAVFFGEPTDGKQYSFVISGHHLTIRCDGNSEPGAAFGGPMYYGHSPMGYNPINVFYYQTKSVLSVYDALDPAQRKKAVITGKSPGEQYASVKFRAKSEERPGVAFAELSADQKQLVEKVMRDVLSPYRKEDADEVMEIVKANGGMDKVQLAFYQDAEMNDKKNNWHFWRLEGPGFVWNYRCLPHVHTFVNIAKQA